MNKLLIEYLKMKGKHHNNINEFFCEIMNETKGNILQQLVNCGLSDFRDLSQFLFKNQLSEIVKELK